MSSVGLAVPTLAQELTCYGNSPKSMGPSLTKEEEDHDRARARRKAKAQMMKRLDVHVESGAAVRDPLFQRAVAALLINGYTPGDISRATKGHISENQVLSTLRSLLVAEIKEIAPLARASRSWPRAN